MVVVGVVEKCIRPKSYSDSSLGVGLSVTRFLGNKDSKEKLISGVKRNAHLFDDSILLKVKKARITGHFHSISTCILAGNSDGEKSQFSLAALLRESLDLVTGPAQPPGFK